MFKGFKFRLLPNKEQLEYFNKASKVARNAYNYGLELKRIAYQDYNLNLSQQDIRKQITIQKQINNKDFKMFKEVSNNIHKQAIKDLDKAFSNFFTTKSKFPRFKSAYFNKKSFYVEKINFTKEGYIKIEKLNSEIRLTKDATSKNIHNIKVPIYNIRIIEDNSKWYITFGIKIQPKPNNLTNEVLGIDVGIKSTYVDSLGNIYHNINKTKEMKKLNERKENIQRKLSKKPSYTNKRTKNSNKVNKLLKKQRKIQNKINNKRKNYNHQISSNIMKKIKPNTIVMESLNIVYMLKNKNLSKAIQEQSLNQLKQFIKYKAELNSIKFIEVPNNFPSTQLCSNCNHKQQIPLSQRTYKCLKCNIELDRDLNAALNLKQYGLNAQTS